MTEISTTWILGHLPLKFVSKSPNDPFCRFLPQNASKTDFNDNMSSYSDGGALSRHFEYAGARARAMKAKSEASEK